MPGEYFIFGAYDDADFILGFIIEQKVHLNYFADNGQWYATGGGMRVFQPFMLTAVMALYIGIHQVDEDKPAKRRRRKSTV